MIGLAYKNINISSAEIKHVVRDQLESNLTFVGFLIMQNKLKAATIPTLLTLAKAKVRCIMATGDNMLTALSVGRKAQLLTKDETVFLGDLSDDGKGLVWKISTDEEEAIKDNLPDLDKTNVNITNQILPWEDMQENEFSIAITGKAFHYLRDTPSLKAILLYVLRNGRIFARMTPDDKARLVEEL